MAKEKTVAELEVIAADALKKFVKDFTGDDHKALVEAFDSKVDVGLDNATFSAIDSHLAGDNKVKFTEAHARDVGEFFTQEFKDLFNKATSDDVKGKEADKIGDAIKEAQQKAVRFLVQRVEITDEEVLKKIGENVGLELPKLKEPPRSHWIKVPFQNRFGRTSWANMAISAAIAGVGILGARAMFFGGRDDQPIPSTYENHPQYGQPQQPDYTVSQGTSDGRAAAMAQQQTQYQGA